MLVPRTPKDPGETETAERLRIHANELWRRFTRQQSLTDTQGFHVEPHETLPGFYVATLYGGAHFVGTESQVRVATRDYVGRLRRQKPK